ncbi:Uncharacterised protein [Morganella morganii]|nr:Uncharacterised protein [Morganella morganii]
MSLQLWIANKNYSSWSLRPWFLLKALNIPFDEQLTTFVPGGSSYEKFLRFSPSGLIRPGFDKNKMPRVFLIDKQIITDTQRLTAGGGNQFFIHRHQDLNGIRLHKIFSNHF